ncbi:trans-aconitate 2-methyltransferase [Amaricoccus solimangrovi]|uniref:Trans-aconitate 2-methyltransferase n=1 Tax=Amaricoccus solimangrovi TaxID=2589815 RepID=A0A501WEI2_9RHOB|nr:trans-aconitate 2-methyltransferase [Amaricoccus solimangrovi]TPE47989.1 trans-aconitate 2-methyltransferase [Amaricoccus solimangrovi]
MSDWSAARYLTFERERTRPVRDLLAEVPAEGIARAVDLGCGPGNSTGVLAARFPGAEVEGIDSSPDMIAAARERLPALRFTLGDLRDRDGAAPDLMLANAVLQWLPDHARLIPALGARLAPGGWLALQMPDNLDEPSHALMREVAARGPWAERLRGVQRDRLLAAEEYLAIFQRMGAEAEVWRTTYYHQLAGHAAIVDWLRATGLRSFLDPLGEAERDEFTARYLEELRVAYSALPDGRVALRFPRLFLLARMGRA